MGENIYNYKIIDNGDMTGNIQSVIQDLSRTDGFSIVASITGSPEGTLHVELGNSDNDLTIDPDSIVNVSGVTRIAYEKPDNTFDKVQVIYTATSGSGTLNVMINGKGDSR